MKTQKHIALAGILAVFAIALGVFAACEENPTYPDPAHTHTWGAWQETTVPTCTAAGIQTRTCTVCGAADTQTQEGTAALGHDWNAVKEVISAVSETENGIKAITCKRDKLHTKDEEVNEYATGTAGLAFTLITTGDYADTYEVKKGTFDGAVLHIPAYHRPTADDDYIPVTGISGFGGNISTPNTTLTTVTFAKENQLKSIGESAFSRCTGLASITIPDSVMSIGNQAFSNCTSLTSMTIPSSVTSIGSSAFNNCTNLTSSITIPASVTSIGVGAFQGCTGLTSITVDANNPNYASEGGILYNKTRTTLIAYPSATGSFTIPASVTSIGDSAFLRCSSLTSITIPDSVTTIGRDVFSYCTGLISVTIPAGVTSIRTQAFNGCTSLTNITIPASVTSIDSYAFATCTSLTSIIIPASVTTIESSAFSNWTNSQTINVPFANAGAKPSNWNTNWNLYCNAVIKYWNGTTWE